MRQYNDATTFPKPKNYCTNYETPLWYVYTVGISAQNGYSASFSNGRKQPIAHRQSALMCGQNIIDKLITITEKSQTALAINNGH